MSDLKLMDFSQLPEPKNNLPLPPLSELAFSIGTQLELGKFTYDNAKAERMEEIIAEIENGIKNKVVPLTFDLLGNDLEEDRAAIEERLGSLPKENLDTVTGWFENKEMMTGREQKMARLKELVGDKEFKHWSYSNKNKRATAIFKIASFLGGSPVEKGRAFEQSKEALQGKKILIIGDDVGTLSEILNRMGAQAFGIESDDEKVNFAHSGLLSEDFTPQTQVIKGDAWDLRTPSSKLFRLLQDKGPFDMIFSHMVLNGGSGFTEYSPNDKNCWTKFISGTSKLLAEKGLILHTRVDYSYFDAKTILETARLELEQEDQTGVKKFSKPSQEQSIILEKKLAPYYAKFLSTDASHTFDFAIRKEALDQLKEELKKI